MTQEKCPTAGVNRPTGGNWKPWKHSGNSAWNQAFADPLAEPFAERVREAEATLIAAAWVKPVALNDEAFQAGLAARDFAFDLHRAMFIFLIVAAERGFRPTIGFFLNATRAAGFHFDDFAVLDVLSRDFRSGLLPLYVKDVKGLAGRRAEIASLHRRITDLATFADSPADMAKGEPAVRLSLATRKGVRRAG